MERLRGFTVHTLVIALLTSCGDGASGPETPDVASVLVTPDAFTLAIGGTQQLTAIPQDEEGHPLAGRPVTWATSAPTVAEVSATGVVSAVGPGSATIIATSEGKSGNSSASILVPVASVSVTPGELTFVAGLSQTLAAIPKDGGGNELTGRSISWATSAPAVAAVSTAGVVNALAPGSATITATSEGKNGSATIVIVGPVAFTSVAAGGAHTCALTADGAAFCWGRGESGQLGIEIPRSKCQSDLLVPCSMNPVAVRGGLAFTQLTGGGAHTCGLTSDGSAHCWGNNTSGQLGDNSTTNRYSPVPVATALKFVSIDAGTAHTCGLTSDDAAYCWGSNSRGALGNGTTIGSSVPVPVTGGHSFQRIAAGGFTFGQTCALTTADEAYCWGDNERGQLGIGSADLNPHHTPEPVSGGLTFHALTAGLGRHTCGLIAGGAAHCWGENSFGALGNNSTSDSPVPVPVSGGLTFAHLVAGGFIGHTCGLTGGGTAYCWGENERGAVGDRSNVDRLEPAAVDGAHSFQTLDAGFRHSCGRTTTGTVYCWGSNGAGQLGIDTDSPQNAPTKVVGQP